MKQPMSRNKKGILAVLGCCLAVFWPGALTFGFPGVMAPLWQTMFDVGSAATGIVVLFMLAAVGIFGVLSFSVAQRTHEIGVRAAVGAEPRQVLGMVVQQAALLAGIGIAAGAASAVGLTRVMKNLLFGISATDPWICAANSAALLAIAITAAVLPALHAARVDPVVALRHE